MTEVTRILSQIEQGDPSAAEQLLPLVYTELRSLAEAKLRHEKPGQTLQPTALVHEAYLRLVDVERAAQWDGRAHFFSAAAEAMRRILVESARRKRRLRHGGGQKRLDLDVPNLACDDGGELLLALSEALDDLAGLEPVAAEVVKLRYFAGMTAAEAANLLGISLRTANRHWAFAKAWLYRAIHDES